MANTDDPGFLARAWGAYVETARTQKIAAEFIRFHPLANNSRFYGGTVEEDRQTVWVNLELDDLFGSYQTRVRTAIRKAQKSGVRFRWLDNDQITSRFAPFYRAGMAAISASAFYFFEDSLFQPHRTVGHNPTGRLHPRKRMAIRRTVPESRRLRRISPGREQRVGQEGERQQSAIARSRAIHQTRGLSALVPGRRDGPAAGQSALLLQGRILAASGSIQRRHLLS